MDASPCGQGGAGQCKVVAEAMAQLDCSDASSEMKSRVYAAVSEKPAPVTATVVASPMKAPGDEAAAQLDGEKVKYSPRPCAKRENFC